MDHVELARKPLQEWLWEEFDVKYSEAVLNEFTPFKEKVGFRGNLEKHVWRFPNISSYESAIFSSHQKKVAGMYCNRCKQTTWKYEMFAPILTEDKDKGERFNCCLALHATLESNYSQIIFLTDDLRARRDYTSYFFDIFPIGTVWSLLDFIIYLFVRHRKDISLDDAKNTLRDVNTMYGGATGIGNQEQQNERKQYEESEKKQHRLVTYSRKVDRIHQIFSQI